MKVLLLLVLAVLWIAGLAQAAPEASGRQRPSIEALKDYIAHPIRFAPFCFGTTEFPQCDFDNPEAVKALVGPYSITCSFYNSACAPVTSADAPGRYAAVVSIHRDGGGASTRFVTLFRFAGSLPPADSAAGSPPAYMQPALLEAAGIDKDVLAGRADEFGRLTRSRVPRERREADPRRQAASSEAAEAVMLAGLHDLTALKAAGQPLPADSLVTLDRKWWVTFKRSYYGYDKVYPSEFVCPVDMEGEPATVVHEGTLAEAGMAADSPAVIDAACETWVKEIGVGFSLCVARRGVIVVNKGYGTRAQGDEAAEPFTASTPGPLASTTKFLSSILLAEFVDKGLIGLDEPVGVYVPPLRNLQPRTAGRHVTVRDCYLHLAGFSGQQGDLMNDLEEMVADLYPALEAGLKHEYDGMGLAVGGKIMEMISGQSIPALYRKHLFDPLGCGDTDAELTPYGATSTAMDLARVGQMMLNGGAYGGKRFLRPGVIRAMMPIAGRDRFEPDTAVRWGVGIKQFDIDGLSDEAYGHPGASGSCLVVDPSRDLVIAMVRFTEGPDFRDFLRRKAVMYKAILDCISD